MALYLSRSTDISPQINHKYFSHKFLSVNDITNPVSVRVKILPPEIAEKIAAGEVVERPVSVVKELVENSIDAGAKRIVVEVKEGGLKEIKVTDNGCGMSREDAILAFKRHATSKISDEEDLFRIATLGFRGEALPSIAAVSRVELITKTKEDLTGTRIIIEGGEVKKIEDVGAKNGTTIIVRDLFYNTPARRKFLKGPQREFYYISDLIEKYALAYEDIHFTLVKDGKKVLDAAPGTLRERVGMIWGRDIAVNSIEIHRADIVGVVSKPHIVRKDKSKIITIVNGRVVKNKVMEDALINGYGTLLFRDSYPYAVIKLTIPPSDVDVNVHPAKLIVKFRNENEIYKKISESVWNALTSISEIPDKKIDATSELKKFTNEKFEVKRSLKDGYFEVETPKQPKKIEDYIPQMRTYPAELLGQVLDTYIVLKTKDALMLVDQHAAHERIRYERFLHSLKNGSIQSILEPIVIYLSPGDYENALAMIDELKEFGFIIEDFGAGGIIVRAIPPMLTKNDAEEALREVIAMGKKALIERRDEIIKLIACKGAIKANQKLSVFEMENLINELFRCENPYTCPHGRPTMIKITKEKLEKLFKRRE